MINSKFKVVNVLIVFFVVIVSISFIYNNYIVFNFNDFKKEFLDIHKGEKDNLFIVGSSRMQGINEGITKCKTVNLAYPGTDFYQTFMLSSYIIENLNPKELLIEITPYYQTHNDAHYKIKLRKGILLNFHSIQGKVFFNNYILYQIKKDFLTQSNLRLSIKNKLHFIKTEIIGIFKKYIFIPVNPKKIQFSKKHTVNVYKSFFDWNCVQEHYQTNTHSQRIENKAINSKSNKTNAYTIEYYFMKYLSKQAEQNGVKIKYVVPLTLNIREEPLGAHNVYLTNNTDIHRYKTDFNSIIYKDKYFKDYNHLNCEGLKLYYNEIKF